MLDKSTNSEEVPQLIERHLLDQYSIDRRGKAVLVCNFFVFLTFNINYSHLCLGAVVNDIYLIPSICIFQKNNTLLNTRNFLLCTTDSGKPGRLHNCV